MRLSLRSTGLMLCLVLSAAGNASAGFVTVGDGSLADWGLTVVDNGSFPISELPANTTNTLLYGQRTLPNGFTYDYALEDQDDTNADELGPNGGGQMYDSEFLGVGMDGDNLVIAIVTGMRSDNPVYHFSPGDIRIQTSLGVFGVEVGGGPGDRPYHADAIAEGGLGTTYYMDVDATTLGALTSDGIWHYQQSMAIVTDPSQQAGSVWQNPDWILDPLVGGFGDFTGLLPVQLVYTNGTLKGLADYSYSWNDSVLKHAIIEVAIPKSWFGGATIESVQWTTGCGNDVLYVEPSSTAPEPSSLALAALGGLLACGTRRRNS